jgi:hypothetical protein
MCRASLTPTAATNICRPIRSSTSVLPPLVLPRRSARQQFISIIRWESDGTISEHKQRGPSRKKEMKTPCVGSCQQHLSWSRQVLRGVAIVLRRCCDGGATVVRRWCEGGARAGGEGHGEAFRAGLELFSRCRGARNRSDRAGARALGGSARHRSIAAP